MQPIMKIAYATKTKEAAQAGINSLHLPFPKALKTTLATPTSAEGCPSLFGCFSAHYGTVRLLLYVRVRRSVYGLRGPVLIG
jgi:hypothetical protein